ncbi:phosphopantothenate synthase [Algimonas arctica]|uniref:Coenzyme A biosynthesis bifunctional protein CoaBC n=1 Tax=Algimonas arctica TaxID=1479486 RepID=A0A8J3G2U9_9PROT|nr:bifunctional phosphopantothenoylcysteine decarboxylase/phosphopantothenate--cysteine ligase CoaBC [Algimonas arctica]GHA96786.1 phosphopantothenate synthase [Algimonas arctica]
MNKSVLLIIGGGIAAYKSLLLIRELARRGVTTRVILTKGGTQFVTPLSAQALSGSTVFTDLWDLTAESEMGHIELSRSSDLIVVAPATANILAQAAHGVAGDLATTTLLATDKRVLYAPAMNVRMYESEATQANIATLAERGALFVGPDAGEMACGEFGDGRMAEPDGIADVIMAALQGDMTLDGLRAPKPLLGRRAIVTAGPTREPIDPVRYLSNHSSGRQGYAIAQALADLGAQVDLVTGPTAIAKPLGPNIIAVETAEQMHAAVHAALPADIFVAVAAVADWRPAQQTHKKTKKPEGGPAPLQLVENPDILRSVCLSDKRPNLVVGFAAETHDVMELARAKRVRKDCDWIVANDVSGDVMGGQENEMIIITDAGETRLPKQSKQAAARALSRRIAAHFGETS